MLLGPVAQQVFTYAYAKENVNIKRREEIETSLMGVGIISFKVYSMKELDFPSRMRIRIDFLQPIGF